VTKEEYNETLEKYMSKGWNHIERATPPSDGVYNTIILKGSMTKKFSSPTLKLFRNGSFPCMDWDYVILWKKIN
jgi:hypothetical protein